MERNKLTENQWKVLRVLAGFGHDGAPKTEFKEACSDMPPSTFHDCKNKLRKKFKIDKRTDGNKEMWWVIDWTGLGDDI